MNNMSGSGTISKDFDLRISDKGVKSISMNVVIESGNYKKEDGSLLNLVAFGTNAENIAKFFKKGSGIEFVASVETSMYKDELKTWFEIKSWGFKDKLVKEETN